MPRSMVNAWVKSQSQYWTWCNLIQRSKSKQWLDSLQCLDLSQTQCLHLYHSGRAKKIDLNPVLSFCLSLFTFYWRGKSGKDVKTISVIVKNPWNDDFFPFSKNYPQGKEKYAKGLVAVCILTIPSFIFKCWRKLGIYMFTAHIYWMPRVRFAIYTPILI